jgi:hypothetical protein
MKRIVAVAAAAFVTTATAQEWRVSSEQTVGGFVFPESCAYDPDTKALYVGSFGGEKLDPAAKDGKGSILKVDLHGKVIDKQYFPAADGEPLNKPKGIWIEKQRLWVTDIDHVWVFNIRSKKGRKLELPLGFANDVAVLDKALYVSDNRNDRLVKIEPADFLNAKGSPKIDTVFIQSGVNPNGLYPSKDGMLLMVGFLAPDKPRPIFALGVSGQIKTLSEPIGRLDGVWELKDGSILATDWNTGSLFQWSEKGGKKELAKGFKGPADFCVIPGDRNSMTVVVPDLPAGQLRFVHLRNK